MVLGGLKLEGRELIVMLVEAEEETTVIEAADEVSQV